MRCENFSQKTNNKNNETRALLVLIPAVRVKSDYQTQGSHTNTLQPSTMNDTSNNGTTPVGDTFWQDNYRYFVIWGGIIFFTILFIQIKKKDERTFEFKLEVFVKCLFGIDGFASIVGFFLHAFDSENMAKLIGWPAGNPFQIEVASSNLALGVIGYMCFWRPDFYLPSAIAKAIFVGGAGITHVLDSDNHASGNSGIIVYWNFIRAISFIPLAVYVNHCRAKSQGEQKKLDELENA